ncbi:MAG: hypothetical protein ABI664_13685 [bacterium]
MTRTYALSAQELSRRLITNAAFALGAGALGAGALGAGALGAALAASEAACRELARSLGGAGFNALLTRALLQAEAEHPLLKDIHVGHSGEPILGGAAEIVAAHGPAAVAAALEAMLAIMFGLLGRLIGDDMVPRLVERKAPDGMNAKEDVK